MALRKSVNMIINILAITMLMMMVISIKRGKRRIKRSKD